MKEAPGLRGACHDALATSTSSWNIVDELSFQLSMAYPRGGDKITLKASSTRERNLWMTDKLEVRHNGLIT
jgi:hypothetical protein